MINTIRDLGPANVEALQNLLESVPDYAERIAGYPPGPADAPSALISVPAGKRGTGLWNGADLVAFADILFGYPDPAAAYIGLFIVHGDHPGKGLGRELHDAVLARVHRQSSAERLRLGIVEKNAAAAEPFWRALGYLPTGERKTVPLRQTQQYRHPLGTAHRAGSLKSTESRPVEDPAADSRRARHATGPTDFTFKTPPSSRKLTSRAFLGCGVRLHLNATIPSAR